MGYCFTSVKISLTIIGISLKTVKFSMKLFNKISSTDLILLINSNYNLTVFSEIPLIIYQWNFHWFKKETYFQIFDQWNLTDSELEWKLDTNIGCLSNKSRKDVRHFLSEIKFLGSRRKLRYLLCPLSKGHSLGKSMQCWTLRLTSTNTGTRVSSMTQPLITEPCPLRHLQHLGHLDLISIIALTLFHFCRKFTAE